MAVAITPFETLRMRLLTVSAMYKIAGGIHGDAPGLVQLGADGWAIVAAVPNRPVSSKRVDGVGLAKWATQGDQGENCGREQAHGHLLADFLEFHVLTGNPPLVTAMFPSEIAYGLKKRELLGQRRVSQPQLR
jgi:hypothetical protein